MGDFAKESTLGSSKFLGLGGGRDAARVSEAIDGQRETGRVESW